MTKMLATPDTAKVLPIPLPTLMENLDLFAGFNHIQLQAIAAQQPAAMPAQHPVVALESFRGRPELWNGGDQEIARLKRRREAYTYGVTVGTSLLLLRHMQLNLDIATEIDATDNSAVTGEIFDVARASGRFLVSQFIDTDEDVLDIVISRMEVPALHNRMPWLTGHEHDPGHRDYFHVGFGDRLAEYAIRHGDMHPKVVPLV